MRQRLLIADRPLNLMTEDQFNDVIQSLRQVVDSKASKAVEDITLTFGNRIIVRFNRPNKTLTKQEVDLLAVENAKTTEELLALFTSRKIKVIDEEGKVLNEPEPKLRKRRSKKAKTNDGSELTA